MFANRISRIRRQQGFSRRYSTQLSSAYPFSKLRAFPFQLSPDDAVIQLGPFASIACMFNGIIGSLGARLLPGFGFQPLQPLRITPVYFPAWIIDAEVQATVSHEGLQRTTTAQFHDSYLPGSDFKVLSLVSLLSKQLQETEPVPFTKELETQHGTEISCLPYTISPFSVLDVAHSLSYSDATIDENLHFTPSSVKPTFFAAYPVLIPLYLAQYEYTVAGIGQARPVTFTMFIEAYSDKGRIMSEPIGAEAGKGLANIMSNPPSALIGLTKLFDIIQLQFLRGSQKPFARIAGLLMPNKHDLPLIVARWFDDLLSSPGQAEKLASMSVVDSDSDLRIREYTAPERYSNFTWMTLGAEITSTKMIMEAMTSDRSTIRIVSAGQGKDLNTEGIVKGAVQHLQERVDVLESKRIETEPKWWKSWLERSGASGTGS